MRGENLHRVANLRISAGIVVGSGLPNLKYYYLISMGWHCFDVPPLAPSNSQAPHPAKPAQRRFAAV